MDPLEVPRLVYKFLSKANGNGWYVASDERICCLLIRTPHNMYTERIPSTDRSRFAKKWLRSTHLQTDSLSIRSIDQIRFPLAHARTHGLAGWPCFEAESGIKRPAGRPATIDRFLLSFKVVSGQASVDSGTRRSLNKCISNEAPPPLACVVIPLECVLRRSLALSISLRAHVISLNRDCCIVRNSQSTIAHRPQFSDLR